MSMKDFLNLYFRQLHFNAMPDAVRNQFDDYVAANSFRGDMKSWRDDLLKKDASGNLIRENGKKGHFVVNDLPEKTAMDNQGWTDLYNALWNTFDRMDGRRDTLNKDTVKFLDEFFGERKTFKPVELDNITRDAVRVFFDKILDTHSDEEYNAIFSLFQNFAGDNDEDIEVSHFEDFKRAIRDGSYERKPDVRQKLRKFIKRLEERFSNSYFYDSEDPLVNKIRSVTPTLNAITSGFAKRPPVTTADIGRLQGDIEKILTGIHKNEKIATDLKSFDKGKITGPLEDAIKKTDYTGKITEKDFVPERYPDKKNIWQRTADAANKFKDNVLARWTTEHHNHIYKIPGAKAITEAMISVGVKPTDGIESIIKNKDKIIEKLQNKVPLESLDQFKWFVAKIDQFTKGNMKSAVEGALREGPKLNRLAEALANSAIEETNNGKNTIENAKAAMEMLTVMSYGVFTSRRLDNLRGTDVKLFNDKGYSFYNDKTAPFLGALDKTVKAGLVLVGGVTTVAANRVRKIGTRFNHSGQLEKGHQKFQTETEAAKIAEEAAKTAQDNADDTEIAAQTTILTGTGITDAADLTTKKGEVPGKISAESTAKTNADTAREAYGAALQTKKDYNDRDYYIGERDGLKNTKLTIEAELSAKPDTLTNQLERAQVNAKQLEYRKVLRDLAKMQAEIDAINKKYPSGLDAEYAKITTPDPATGKTPLKQLEDDWTAKQGIYNAAKDEREKLEKNISDYESATANIDFYTKSKEKRQADWDKWGENHRDYYNELMGFWDFLQTGKTSGLFYISKKNLQKRYEKMRKDGKTRMDHIYDNWMDRHGYAA